MTDPRIDHILSQLTYGVPWGFFATIIMAIVVLSVFEKTTSFKLMDLIQGLFDEVRSLAEKKVNPAAINLITIVFACIIVIGYMFLDRLGKLFKILDVTSAATTKPDAGPLMAVLLMILVAMVLSVLAVRKHGK
jgi:hypothetical protein